MPPTSDRTDRNGSVGTGHSACPRRALGLGRPAQRGSGAGLVGEAGEIVWLVDVLEGAGCPVDRPPHPLVQPLDLYEVEEGVHAALAGLDPVGGLGRYRRAVGGEERLGLAARVTRRSDG